MIKNENYIVIQGFMLNELKLKGNELIIYAIIYGFSQTEDTKFTGSLKYLADCTGTSKQTVISCLKSLVDKGLVIKEVEEKNGVKFNTYLTPSKNFLIGGVKIFKWGSQKILPNNIDNNIINNKDILTSEKIACNTPKIEPKKEKILNPLQEFSNEVAKKFERLEDFQLGIWFKRNCRCLSDILKFCGGKKEDIPLAIECINVCCDIMAKKGFEGAGYEAVCRNLPYYYGEAKKRLNKE